MTGANEVPANASQATATATVMVNRATGVVTVSGSYLGMTPTIAHIHQPAAVGAIANPITPGFVIDPTTSTFTYSATFTAQQVADIVNGMSYVNIHSAAPYTAGEIRGQIQ